MATLDELVRELRVLRRRTFGELDERTLAANLPRLASAARRVYGASDDQQVPLRKLITAAGRRVTPEELRPAVADLFGLTNDTLGAKLEYRQDTAARRFVPRPAASTFRQAPQYTRRLTESLAAAIAELLAGATQSELRQRDTHELVDRPDLVDAGVALLGDGPRMLWVWGEPGTGKTVLADKIADRMAPLHPVIRVRLANSHAMQEDLIQALGDADGDAAARQFRFRRLLDEDGSVGVVILDDADSPAQVADLGLRDARVPIIVTSRSAPDEGVAGLRVGNLSIQEAELAVRALLPDLGEEDTARLAKLSGGRPLVVNQVSHYLRTAGPDAHTVLDGLEYDTGRTLGAIGSTTERNLTAIYQGMLDDFAVLGDTVAVLDTLLWITVDGLVDRPLAQAFLAHRLPGPAGSVTVTSAEVVLARRGVVQTVDNAFVIHSPTGDVLRRLRRESMTAVITDYVDFLSLEPPPQPANDERGLIHAELRITEGLWDSPDERNRLLLADERTWLRVRYRDGEVKGSAILYRILHSGISVQVDGQDSEKLGETDADELVDWTKDYYECATWRFEYAAEGEGEPTELGDGYVHRRRRRTGTTVDSDIHQSVCGKRWRIGLPPERARELPECPSCAKLTWRDAVLAWTQTGLRTTRRQLLSRIEEAIAARDASRALTTRDELDEFLARTRPQPTTTLVGELAAIDTALGRLVRLSDPGRALALHRDAATGYEQCAFSSHDEERFTSMDKLAGAHVSQAEILASADPDAAIAAYDAAIKVYRGYLILRPDDVPMSNYLGLALGHQADLLIHQDRANAVSTLDEAISLHRDALARDDFPAFSRRLVADALYMRGNHVHDVDPQGNVESFAEAAEHYRLLLETDHDDADLIVKCVSSLYRVADANRDDPSPAARDRWAEVETYQRHVLNLRPGDPDELHNLGVILLRRVSALRADAGSAAVAAALHTEATTLFTTLPDAASTPSVLLESASALHKLAQIAAPDDATAAEAAVTHYRSYLEHHPEDPQVLLDLGKCLMRQARLRWPDDVEGSAVSYAEAADRFRASLGHRPDHLETRGQLIVALLDHAHLVDDASLYAETAAEVRRSMETSPDDPILLRQLGVALADRAELLDAADADTVLQRDEAVALLRRSWELRDDGGTAAELGRVLAERAKTQPHPESARQEAEQYYLAYLRARPDDPAVHYNLACLHGCRGDAWRAVGKLATWWRTTPKKPGVRRAQVDADSDFDLVRDDPWFTAFLARNTEAD